MSEDGGAQDSVMVPTGMVSPTTAAKVTVARKERSTSGGHPFVDTCVSEDCSGNEYASHYACFRLSRK